jgi:hypothetical protein
MNDPRAARPNVAHRITPLTRREMLVHGGGGFGALALSYLLGDQAWGASPAPAVAADLTRPSPLAWKRQATARSCIFLFMEGGPSHIDLFDPKPKINALSGKPLPASFAPVIVPGGNRGTLMPSPRTWKQAGQSGLWFSEWVPEISTCADDLAMIHSCWANGLNHVGAVCQMNTGSVVAGRPSLGSWVSYGLGTENENLPAFVVLQDNPKGIVAGGPRNWGAGFMPAVYQGTRFHNGNEPIPFLGAPKGVGEARQRGQLDYLGELNRRYAESQPDQTELEARIKSFELAFRMQGAAPDAVDLSRETEETRALYGLDRKETEAFGRNCLLARRLVERGVRFVQLYCGAGAKWDAHTKLEENHSNLCQSMDWPVAGLLKDLKRRGLLDSTLVIWGGEFGRTPMSQALGSDGRDHNPYGFTTWLAGGGVKGGQVIGSTDEIGLHAVEDRLHVHDLHATYLHLMGLDHTKLVFLHKGRPERATLNEGEVFEKLASG